MNSLAALQKQKSSERLVLAAAAEKLSTNRQRSSSKQPRGFKGIAKGSWDKIVRGPKPSLLSPSDDSIEESEERDASASAEREIDDDSAVADFFGRLNITVESVSRKPDEKPKVPSKKKTKRGKTKSVKFHKYDEVIYADVKEYVYSLHDIEVEEEKANYDLADELEVAVGDVGYFFRCLKEGIQEEAAKSLRGRKAYRRWPPKA